ncbi:MAG: SpoIIE family protein phosphatase [Ignavibacterium sp.]|nr:SpoIIE family protein phosphatase [Ignavibacterium sp.]
MNSKKEKLLKEAYSKLLEVGFGDGPLETINQFIDDDVMGYGTAQDEKIMSIQEFRDLLIDQRKQAVNFDDFSFTSKPLINRISGNGNTAVIVDEIVLLTRIQGEANELAVRMSSVFEFRDGYWKLIHWHSSKPEHISGGDDPWHINEWKRKNEELQKLVDEKTSELLNKNRELEIEASLERVRAVAMSMNKSDDLLSICEVSFKEFQKLGFNNLRNAIIHIPNDEQKYFMDYDFSESIGGAITKINYGSHPIVDDYLEKIRSAKDAYFEVVINEAELAGWKDFRRKSGQKDDIRLDEATAIYYYVFSIGVGDIGISAFKPIDNSQKKILKRFRNVFDLAYRRYNDIALAETQAREAKIELALERVRARTMAMQSSNELKDVVANMFDGLKSLGVDPTVCNISLIDNKTFDSDVWSAHQTDNGFITYRVFISHFEHPFRKKLIDSFLNRISFSVHELSGDLKKSYIQYLIENVDYSKVPDEVTKSNEKLVNIEEGIVLSAAYMKYGLLIVSRNHAISNDESEILQRFARVFEQTYTRFLDLQKAEAQARESQIELALERVRARTMAMQRSEELSKTALVLFQQFNALGEDPDQLSIGIVNESEKVIEIWLSVQGNIMNKMFKAPIDEPIVINKIYTAWKEKGKSVIIDISGDELKRYHRYVNSHVDYKEYNDVKDRTGREEKRRIIYTALFSKGLLSIATQEPRTEETIKLLERFAGVFDGTYTRFLDLKKAEAQAREAQIEASLEKVRAHTMGMQSSEDLSNVASVMFDQMKNLGGELFAFGIVLCDKHKVMVEQWHNLGNEGMISPFSVPVDLDYIHRYRYDKWKAGEELFSIEIPEDYIARHFELMFELPSVKAAMDEVVAQGIEVEIPDWEIDYGASFKHGYLLVSSRKPFKENHIFPRFAKVFDQAYTRFLDLQKAEAQAREAQIEAALERVRSKTMAMHNSADVGETVVTLFDQLLKLGIRPFRCGIGIFQEEYQSELWTARTDSDNKTVLVIGQLDMSRHPLLLGAYKGWKNKQSLFTYELRGSEVSDYFTEINNQTDYPVKYDLSTLPSLVIHNDFYFAEGSLFVFSLEPLTAEVVSIFKRFALVFGQTYRRYLDLQKAEAQAREAQIELSLERIRAQVTAMRESSELLDIVVTMRSEFVTLGHEAHYFWHMRWLPERYDKAMTSGDGTRIGMVMTLPRHIHGDVKLVADWEKSDEPTLVFAMDVDTAVKYVEKMITLGDFQQVDPQAPTLDDIRHIGGLTFVMARTTHGEIGFSLPGTVPNPPEESITTLARFAGVFDLAYKRFEDLKSTERQHRVAQIELALERTRTQSMLMQHSSELNDISKTFHEQLLNLRIDSEFSFVWLPDEDNQKHMFWATWVNEINGVAQYQSKSIKYPLDKTEPGTAKCYRDWESAQPVHETYVPPDQIVSFFATWDELLRGADQFEPELFPEGIYYIEAYMKYGCFGIDIRRPLTLEEKEVIRRFSVEFERTYTRFLDLQKAEAQNKIIQAENERKTKELEDARQLQLSMLPKELPKLPHLDIAVYMKTATEVGGDYYDFNVDANGTLTFIVGDATGHGMMSGMMVSIMKSFFIADRNKIELKQFFENSNNSIKDMQLGRLMMALIGVQITSEKIIATNAGMPSLLYFRNKSQKAGEFVSNNLPLGGMKGTKYMLKAVRYEKGDTLLLMSDGFAELKNSQNEQYGYVRIKEKFRSLVHKSSSGIIEELKTAASQWNDGTEPDDDVSFVVIKFL